MPTRAVGRGSAWFSPFGVLSLNLFRCRLGLFFLPGLAFWGLFRFLSMRSCMLCVSTPSERQAVRRGNQSRPFSCFLLLAAVSFLLEACLGRSWGCLGSCSVRARKAANFLAIIMSSRSSNTFRCQPITMKCPWIPCAAFQVSCKRCKEAVQRFTGGFEGGEQERHPRYSSRLFSKNQS